MKDIIQNRLDRYQAATEQDEENALKEITQEVALYALAKSGFFAHAAFQGGTHLTHTKKKINIKVELDVNPPAAAECEPRFLDFPTDYSIASHDLPSLFAGKLHALLCHSFMKGRDWYDFAWYLSQKTNPNYALLKNALAQHGPWAGQSMAFDRAWVKSALSKKIKALDWPEVVQDVSPFLKAEKSTEIKSLWSEDFFLAKIARLA